MTPSEYAGKRAELIVHPASGDPGEGATVTDTGSRIVLALEAAWRDIQQRHEEIPAVVMITGTARQLGGDRWGHHWPDRWHYAQNDRRDPELFIAGELLAHGGRRVLQTLLHEATHALAHVRQIQDTSRQGRYHNRRFVQLAGELGLDPPATTDKTRGLNAAELGDTTAETYRDTITSLDRAIVAYLEEHPELTGGNGGAGGTGKGSGRGGRRLATECACTPPRRLQLTPKAIDEGPVICGLCGEPFELPEPDDHDDGSDGTQPT